MTDISIVIPTFNRRDVLAKTLASLFDQTYPPDRLEIVVADDGSTDGTAGFLESMRVKARCRLLWARQDKRGPAAARNLGIRNSSGPLVLLFGDDMIAHKELVARHVKCQAEQEGKVAVLGYIAWAPEIKVTPFMRYIGESGHQFGYRLTGGTKDLPYSFFYSSNLSIKRAILLEDGLFDEDFRYPAYEDIELGFRLQQKGLRIVLDKEAIGYHNHPVTLRRFCERQVIAGRSAAIGLRKHPQGFLSPKDTLRSGNALKGKAKRILIPALSLCVDFMDRRNRRFSEKRYIQILDYYFASGLKKGIAESKET
jgi:glycosyltransferase involved in cell wall biosynthesis